HAWAFALAASAGLVLACAAPAAPPPAASSSPQSAAAQEAPAAPPALQRTIIMVANTSAVFLPHKLAELKGFYRAQGLDAQVIVTASNVQAAAIVSGEADFSGQLAAAIRYRLAGMPVLVVNSVVGHSLRKLVA